MRLTIHEKLFLETISRIHAEDLFQLVESNREYLREWMPWEKNHVSIDDTMAFISESEKNIKDSFHAGIFFDHQLCGMIGLHQINYLNRNTSIGYWLDKNHQGKGIVTLAAGELVRYCFQELELHRIEIRCGTSNFKSQAVAERLGFIREGILREAELLNDRYIDHALYAIINS